MPPPPATAASADEIGFVERIPASVANSVRDNVSIGIALIVASTIFFSAGDIAAKILTETLPSVQVTWLRYLVFVALVVPAAFAARGREALKTSRQGLQLVRGVAVVMASISFMLGLEYLQVAEATAINFVSPIFITALSIPLLGEKVGARRFAAAGVGFLGVMLIVRPGTEAFQLAALFPIGAALVWAFATIATRHMNVERPETTLAYTAMVGFLILSALVPFEWRAMSLREVGYGLLTGLLSTAGHWLVIRGYRIASASILAPFSYVQLLFASLFGFAAFGAIPGSWTFVGGAVIAASGLYTAYRERVRAVEAKKAAAV
jgi:drug/metabolite transporter (DMT)-like permease